MMQKERASKYRGVYRCGSKWKSQVQIRGVQHYLGIYDTEEEAAEQYLMFQARRRDRAISSLSEYTHTNHSPPSEQQNVRYHESSATSMNVDHIMAGRLLTAAAQLRMHLIALDGKPSQDAEAQRLEFERLLVRIDETLETLSRNHSLQQHTK